MKNLFYFLIFSIILSFGIPQKAKASHYMGGEITWECLPSGQFKFHLKYYRECGGITFGSNITLESNSPAGTIYMSLQYGWPKDLTPTGKDITGCTLITCAWAEQTGYDNTGAVSEYYYVSSPVTINGVPPASGWTFYHQSCCRNPSTNLNSQPGWRLRAKMFPYNGQNTYPCYDNSPRFIEVARSVLTVGYPFTYNHNAIDVELDSLSYEWGQPLDDNGTAITNYAAGYSYNNPLPGPSQNPNNVAAVVNDSTGEISLTSFTTGAFVTSTKVSAYKCGVLVAEIWRDVQVVLAPSSAPAGQPLNIPPTVNAPFANNTSYDTTVFAGDTVEFTLQGSDFAYLPTNPPTPQTMKLTATGIQFGSYIPGNPSTFSKTNGCLNPPCASLTPAPGDTLTGVFALTTNFFWQTDCDHITSSVTFGNCTNTTGNYNFVLNVFDDYCPIPATTSLTINIRVKSKPMLDAPKIRCTEVLPNGDVTIHWDKPTNDTMNSFMAYEIYGANTLNGPYVKLDSITNKHTNYYTHTGTSALDSSMYYFVNMVSSCSFITAAYDTVKTMEITVLNPQNGTANISWNEIRNPMLPSSTGIYEVYREYPAGVWNYIGNTSSTNYVDTITVCGDSINYKVQIGDTIGQDTNGPVLCYSVSNVDNDYFQDASAPDVPIIDSVSVDRNTGNAVLSWNENNWEDTEGYIIYLEVTPGNYTPIDTVYGLSTTTYIDSVNNACTGNGKYNNYRVASIDSCDNTSNMSDPHRTIAPITVKQICDDEIKVVWEPYKNMESGIDRYELYVSENGGPFTLLSTLYGDTAYPHTNLTKDAQYCYYVRAFDNSGTRTSTSCEVCDVANKPNQPQFSYIQSASVIPTNNAVKLRFLTDTSAFVTLYKVERSNNAGGPWTQIGTVPPSPSTPTLSYTDVTASVKTQAYWYRITVQDSCGEDAITSDPARTMHLEANVLDSFKVKLTWNSYEGFSGNPTQYSIYRTVDGVFNPSPIATLPSTQTSYIDDLAAMMNTSQGTFYYYIYANEGPGNIYLFGLQDSARSNEVIAVQQPKVFVPNVFNPSSNVNDNKTFYPRGQFITDKQYLFQVYNRWGELLFETTKLNDGWDGTYNGQEVQIGAYMYYLRFETAAGELYEKRGSVTIVR